MGDASNGRSAGASVGLLAGLAGVGRDPWSYRLAASGGAGVAGVRSGPAADVGGTSGSAGTDNCSRADCGTGMVLAQSQDCCLVYLYLQTDRFPVCAESAAGLKP